MKIVVVGYGQMFANLILGCLNTNHQIVGVLRHDRVLYDKVSLKIKDLFSPSKDKTFINSLHLHEIEANSVNSEEFRTAIIKLNPDIILVGSWSEKFSQKTINLPKIACINCHPSLLPKYRGANPYAQTIKNGETKTGVTFHLMDSNFDTGAILHQKEVEIRPDDTGKTLKARCANVAKSEISNLLTNLDNEIIIPIEQSEKHASYQKQLQEKDMILDFSKTSIEIDRHIRALIPWMKCYIPHKNCFLKVNEYKILDNIKNLNADSAVITDKKGASLQIMCADNKIIEFTNLKLLNTIPIISTQLYIKLFVKKGEKAI